MSNPTTTDTPDRPGARVAFQIAVAYALLGAGWILVSDRALQAVTPTPQAFARWQSIKGWAYVGVTALLLYAVLRVYVSSRERAESALRESEAKYRSFFQTSRDAVFITSRDGRWLDMNQAAVELFGYDTMEELGAVPVPQLYADPADREAHIRAIAEQGSTWEYPVDLRRKDGTVIHTLITSVARTEDSGDVIGFQGTIRDVTESRRARARIRHLNAVLRAIRDVSQLLLRETDRNRLLQGACDRLIRRRGYESVWVVLLDESGDYQRAIASGVDARFAALAERLERGDLPPCVQDALARRGVVVVAEPGAECPDCSSACATSDDSPGGSVMTVRLQHKGRIYGTLSVCVLAEFTPLQHERDLLQDLADDIAFGLRSVTLEEELRRSEERYRTLFNSASDAILIHRPQGRFLEVNDVACERLGYSREELLRMSPQDIDAPEFADLFLDRVDQLRTEGHLFFETAHVRRDGTQVPTELSSRVIDYEGGEAVLTVARDISQRKELERKLRRQERLAAMGRLAGGVAHDFNNILASIVLNAELASRTGDVSPRVDEALGSILEESHRAADLVEQILDFSRSAMMETETLDLVRLVEQAATLLRRTLPEHVRLTLSVPPQSSPVEADRTRIHQVLMNLAANARDAMPAGGDLGISVTPVSFAADQTPPVPEMPPGDWVCLRVSDTGVGMTDEVRANLFEPFFTTKGEGEGTGLGLAQVYGIVKQHQGYIDVETGPGEGTTFSIYLPPAEDAPPAPDAGSERRPPLGRGETILVVEDAAPLRLAIQTGLESLDYRVLAAKNVAEALDAYHRAPVDLVLTDIVMPDRSGRALLRDLREQEPELRVVAMTGHVSDSEAPSSELPGFAHLIRKPFSIEELAVVIRDALDAA